MVNCIIVVRQNDTDDQNVHTTVLLCDETYGGHRLVAIDNILLQNSCCYVGVNVLSCKQEC